MSIPSSDTLVADLFGYVRFDGATFESRHDRERLGRQLSRVMGVMQDGRWRTLGEIQAEIQRRWGDHAAEASISARLRDMRKERFGGHTVQRRRRGEARKGLFEYRLA